MYYSAEDKARIASLVDKTYVARKRKSGIEPSQRAPRSVDALLGYAEDVKLCRHVAICELFPFI